ncbi:uncharacterized protein M421DRAFT_134645 [Didymella exigua CBS 183.55]|uniref:Uncharacterized protein n=1 Tax=Didymella exigua CBS 183.55 TaxID=1150837 RepID=A0A6A5RP62_9PLEO|nr:uncharacterized protein M421DRAFT_134645 [Didymella exigua CBS 183.55]KAF1929223.1 hypothetical protein M421DRAFT_134645 [Didymella exigua CBS 183.55]
MFIPRAVRLKGVKESIRPKVSKPSAESQTGKDSTNSKDGLVEATSDTSMNSPAPQQDTASDAPAPTRGPRFTTKPITAEYIAQLAAGIELIFTDYAHQENERSRWLKNRYRVVDGEENYIHLTAILQHPYISKLKPEATQILLKQALHDHPSGILELSRNKYYVRRRPSTNPLPFVPKDSFEIVDDDGLSFWDQRTIYVEPHLHNICPTPARVAQWLTEHGQLKQKWLPIQAVHTLWNSCAFVVLSGNVMHEGAWNKWREAGKPEDWKIMTKVEHTRRTAEYRALLEQENPRGMRRNQEDDSKLPPIARSATLPMAFEPLPKDTAVKSEGKKKRKRRKPGKAGDETVNVEQAKITRAQGASNEPDAGMADASEEQPHAAEPATSKKKRKRRKSGRANDVDDTVAAPAKDDSPRKKRRR